MITKIDDTVFSNLDTEEGGIDRDSLEGLFSEEPTKGAAPSTAAAPGKIPKLTMLDGRRKTNIEIMLQSSGLKLMSVADITAAVRTMDTDVLDGDTVKRMLGSLPDQDEQEKILAFAGEEERLGKAESYFLKLCNVPDYKNKLRAMDFEHDFAGSVSTIEGWTASIVGASRELYGSPRLPRLIALVLKLANALHAPRCPAPSMVGFEIKSLLKLVDTRSFDQNTTLLHYLVALIESRDTELLMFMDDVPHLASASALTFTQVEAALAPLNNGLGVMASVLVKASALTDAVGEREFLSTRLPLLQAFHTKAAAKLAECAAELVVARRTFLETAVYLGENPAKLKSDEPERFMKIVSNFAELFNKAKTERRMINAAAAAGKLGSKQFPPWCGSRFCRGHSIYLRQ